jgi:hypothetical protein
MMRGFIAITIMTAISGAASTLLTTALQCLDRVERGEIQGNPAQRRDRNRGVKRFRLSGAAVEAFSPTFAASEHLLIRFPLIISLARRKPADTPRRR